MFTYGTVLPACFLLSTFIFEYVAFLTSHMIDSRSLASLHVGIFLRCSYPITIGHRNEFKCLWWSDDTFNHDETSLKVATIFTFFTLILVGSTVIFLITSFIHTDFQMPKYRIGIAISNLINSVFLIVIIITYAFFYATETRIIPGPSTTLIFSWSFYLLFGALGSCLISAIFFIYDPFKNQKQ